MTGGAVPRAGICSVGSEVVGGEQVDSNGAWLARRLSELAWRPALQVAVGDRPDEIVAALRWLAGVCEVVVVGGGLGPTSDDRTREAVAAAAGVPLEHRDDLESRIRERFGSDGPDMLAVNLRQARVPEGARVYDPVGTAPGFRITLSGPTGDVPVHVLPGIPWELRALFDRDVEPTLRDRSGVVRVTRTVLVAGMSEARLAEAVEAALDGRGAEVAYRASPTGIRVGLTVGADTRAAAEEQVEGVVTAVTDALGHRVASVAGESLEAVVVDGLAGRGQTVAAAESATAGQVCARLADVPGASRVLRGGAVLYGDGTKEQVLGLAPDVLAEGPVSAPVAGALALRVRSVFGSDWGIGVTGVAGPEPHGGREVGAVVWAVADPAGDVDVHERRFRGDRDVVRTRLASAALETLRRHLLEA